MNLEALNYKVLDYTQLISVAAEHNHFAELETTYGHYDAVAIFTAETWAKLLYESLTSEGESFEANLPNLKKFSERLTDLAQNSKWKIGKNLGSYTVGDKLCIAPNYWLYNINDSSQIHNPSFQQVEVIGNIRGEDVSVQSLSYQWKFADLDGKTDYIDLGKFKSLYGAGQLQLIGLPREDKSFESPDFRFTISPVIPRLPILAQQESLV